MDTTVEIQKFLKKLPDNYNHLHKNTGMGVQNEYNAFYKKTGLRELEEKEIMVLGRALQYPNGDVIMKKRALVILANVKSITAFREIEQYYQNPDKELEHWAALALHSSKNLLENSIED